MLSVVVLISGAGTNMLALDDAVRSSGRPDPTAARVVAVGADRPAAGLVEAARRGTPTFLVPWRGPDERAEWAAELAEAVDAHRPDLLVLSGFMRLVPAAFVDHYAPMILNTHPALLPAFPGAHAVEDALAAGVGQSGATVHIVDSGMDTGPIVAQQPVPIRSSDDAASLHARIKRAERVLLADVVHAVADGSVLLDRVAAPGASE